MQYCIDNNLEDLNFFNAQVDKTLLARLKELLVNDFVILEFNKAIDMLIKGAKKAKFENKPEHGKDLSSEHEKWLTEHFKKPVVVKDWPRDIKSFYMKLNKDEKTVQAFDLLIPGIGELIGGSVREEDLETLKASILRKPGMKLED